ncbi:MAG: general secretion pathway protein GspM [Lysobacteraceae bacterium]|nr:MAG: general secretion pathway protein GspM [Xanthomonadaceae bacterium]
MCDAIPDRERWLALGLLAAVVLVGYFLLIHTWWTVPMLELQERIDGLQERDARARAALRQGPEIRKRLSDVRAQAARLPGFMTEASPELATAALIQRLETAVQQASPKNRSCAIQNRSPLTEPRKERFQRAVVQVRLRCGTPELAIVLHSLESGSPRLFVDNLNVLAQRFFFTPDQSPTSGGLDVNFDLYGYLPPPAGAPADAP